MSNPRRTISTTPNFRRSCQQPFGTELARRGIALEVLVLGKSSAHGLGLSHNIGGSQEAPFGVIIESAVAKSGSDDGSF